MERTVSAVPVTGLYVPCWHMGGVDPARQTIYDIFGIHFDIVNTKNTYITLYVLRQKYPELKDNIDDISLTDKSPVECRENISIILPDWFVGGLYNDAHKLFEMLGIEYIKIKIGKNSYACRKSKLRSNIEAILSETQNSDIPNESILVDNIMVPEYFVGFVPTICAVLFDMYRIKFVVVHNKGNVYYIRLDVLYKVVTELDLAS